jgi:hypothetical protein
LALAPSSWLAEARAGLEGEADPEDFVGALDGSAPSGSSDRTDGQSIPAQAEATLVGALVPGALVPGARPAGG